jgi:hypothetical protein
MINDHVWAATLAASERANWRIEDVLGEDDRLDPGRPFLPEALARTDAAPDLGADARRTLNQIAAHQYLSIFGLVEEFILPFVLDHVRDSLDSDDARVRALLGFAAEEAKHIDLFRRFHRAYQRDVGTDGAVIGPPSAVAAHVLGHDPLSVALIILHIEWMTQAHYVESVRGRPDLDPLFTSLLRHHWMEEAQHAKLDTLMVEALAEGRDAASLDKAIDGYFAIGGFLDDGLKAQVGFNLEALGEATGISLSDADREALVAQQHQAARWTYLGSGMRHPKFRATLGAIHPAGLARIDAASPAFC